MENTKQTPQEKSTLSNILEQIKIVLVIYGIVIIIHMVSIGSKLPDLAKSTVVSFAWATLVSFVLTLPISPISDFIVNAMSAYSFGLVGLPLLAFAGIAVGDQLEVFKKLSWKIVIVSFVVMASTYFGSAAISNIILSLKGMI